jgi:hypothetical protein
MGGGSGDYDDVVYDRQVKKIMKSTFRFFKQLPTMVTLTIQITFCQATNKSTK